MRSKQIRRVGNRIRNELAKLLGTSAQRRHARVGPPTSWREKREFQVSFLLDHGLQTGDYLLDLGCGTLRGGLPLVDYLDVGHYTGLDIDAVSLEEARKEVREAGLEDKSPELVHVSDFDLLALNRSFDVVWAFSVLIHMSDTILESAMEFVHRHLGPHGRFLANANFGERPEGHWRGLPVVWRSLPFYADAAGRHGLQVVDLGTIASLGYAIGDERHDAKHMLVFTGAGT